MWRQRMFQMNPLFVLSHWNVQWNSCSELKGKGSGTYWWSFGNITNTICIGLMCTWQCTKVFPSTESGSHTVEPGDPG